MSCEWDLYCADCDVSAGISDANHQEEAMRAMVAATPELGRAFRKLLQGGGSLMDLELRVNFHHVSYSFFADHGDHRLRPRDEYGRYDTPCGQSFVCEKCGKVVACSDREHPGKLHSHYAEDRWYHEENSSSKVGGST